MLKTAVLAPIANSLYSRMVAFEIARDPSMRLTAAIVRTPWSVSRVRSELRRDGPRLVRKAYRKLVLRERGFDRNVRGTLLSVAKATGVPSGSLHALGRQFGFPVHTVRDHNDERSLERLREDPPDVIVFTGGGLLREPLLDIARLGVLNCHMGILPAYRGMDVVEWPLVASPFDSKCEVGLTVHFMDRGVDTGDILLVRPVPTQCGDTFRSIRERLEGLMPQLMLETLRGLRDGTLHRQPQVKSQGQQYFVMHPRIERFAASRLAMRVSEGTDVARTQ